MIIPVAVVAYFCSPWEKMLAAALPSEKWPAPSGYGGGNEGLLGEAWVGRAKPCEEE